MKKEDLVALGLNDEQVNGVFKIRGLEIEADKEVLANLEAEKKAAEQAKAELEAKVTELEKNSITAEDLEAIKQEKSALETKLTEIESAHTKEIEDIKFNNSLKSELEKSGAHNVKTLMTVLNQDELKFEDGKVVGLEEQLKAAKEEHGYLFKTEGELSNPHVTTGSKGAGRTKVDPFKAAANKIIGK